MGGRSFNTTSGALGDTVLNNRHGYLVLLVLLSCMKAVLIVFSGD